MGGVKRAQWMQFSSYTRLNESSKKEGILAMPCFYAKRQILGLKINLEKSSILGITTNQEMISNLALFLEKPRVKLFFILYGLSLW